MWRSLDCCTHHTLLLLSISLSPAAVGGFHFTADKRSAVAAAKSRALWCRRRISETPCLQITCPFHSSVRPVFSVRVILPPPAVGQCLFGFQPSVGQHRVCSLRCHAPSSWVSLSAFLRHLCCSHDRDTEPVPHCSWLGLWQLLAPGVRAQDCC